MDRTTSLMTHAAPPMPTDFQQPTGSADVSAAPQQRTADLSATETGTRRRELYTYEARFHTYGLAWSCREDKPFRLATSSFTQEYANKVDIVQLDEEAGELKLRGSFDHPYPATKILWNPDPSPSGADLLATTGDYLRLWEVKDGIDRAEGTLKGVFKPDKKSDFCAPLTAFDWNPDDAKVIATASIDTTCTIWDVNTQQVSTQLIAHDKETFDVAFGRGKHVFASCGADGSVRMFDLRSLQHSTIVYESKDLSPIMRVAWNKQDPNYLALVLVDSPSVMIVDVRQPGVSLAVLNNHTAAVNGVQWAPHSSCHLCSGGEDAQALIWDISCLPTPVEDAILAYNADGEINALQWSTLQPDWVAISYDTRVQILRV